MLERQKELAGGKVKNIEPILCRVSGVPFYNTSRFTFEKLKGDPNNIAANLTNFIKGFSSRARNIIEHFGEGIFKLDKRTGYIWSFQSSATSISTRTKFPNIEWATFSRTWSGALTKPRTKMPSHFTREVIRLMVNLLF